MTAIPPKVREAIRRRSRGVCEVCGIKPATHMHHRKMRSQGGSHSIDNLLHVDYGCHNAIHQNPLHAYERGWLVKSWDTAP